jgi:hypothetical protein
VKLFERRSARIAAVPINLSFILSIALAFASGPALASGLPVPIPAHPLALATVQRSNYRPLNSTIAAKPANSTIIVQDDDEDQPEVAPADVDKYVAVYKAMQRNRSMTVEQAAAAQGMTVKSFRELENRIERDESAREHARDALRAAASPGSGSPSP